MSFVFASRSGILTCRIFSRQLLNIRRCIDSKVDRGLRRNASMISRDLYKRREAQGPEPERHRSVWSNWNYDAEIFSFGKRLGEEFKDNTIRQAFTCSSYVAAEEARMRHLQVDIDETKLADIPVNDALATQGEDICIQYIKGFLRRHFPLYPEEGICAIHDYLMSEKILVDVANKIGVKDLIRCAEFPVTENDTIIHTFKAIIGAVAQDSGEDNAELFVQDFLLTQLIGKEISELWDMHNPMGILAGILEKHGKPEPEPRLIWESGSETVLSVYMVGIYCDKQLIGKAAGETVSIAEDMAARNALVKIFNMGQDRKPFMFGKEGRSLKINKDKLNPSVLDYCSQGQITQLQ